MVGASVFAQSGLRGMIYLAASINSNQEDAMSAIERIEYPFVSIAGELDVRLSALWKFASCFRPHS